MGKGSLVIVSGFSGAGKGTIVSRLMQQHDNYALSISATTRSPREGEMNGREYFFLGREEFEQKIGRGELLEYAEYVGNYYGTPRDYVESCLEEGKDVILEIEMQGALKVRKVFPSAVLVFVSAPDARTLQDRLRNRGTETEEQIARRLRRAVEESALMKEYDYLIVNIDLEEAVRELHAIVEASHLRMSSQLDFTERISEELSSLKGE